MPQMQKPHRWAGGGVHKVSLLERAKESKTELFNHFKYTKYDGK